MANAMGVQMTDQRDKHFADIDANLASLTDSKASLASPTFTGISTVSGAQGKVFIDTTGFLGPTIRATNAAGAVAPLYLSPETGGTVVIGVNAGSNLTPAASLYLRAEGATTKDLVAIEGLVDGVEAYRIDRAGNHTIGAGCGFTSAGTITGVHVNGANNGNNYITGGGLYYYCATSVTTPASAGFQWPGDQNTVVAPWYVPYAITISNVGLEMKTGATGGGSPTLHMMIYSDNGLGYPGALFCDVGAVDSSGTASIEYITGGVIKFTTPNVATLPVPAGLYWIGARSNGVITDQPYVYGVVGTAGNIPIGTTKPTTGAAFNVGFLHTGAGTTTPTDPFPALGASGAAASANAPRMFVKIV